MYPGKWGTLKPSDGGQMTDSDATPPPTPPNELELQPVWASLTTEPGTAVSLLDMEGRVVYLNERCAEIYFGPGVTPAQVMGKTLDELYPKPFVEERIALLRRVETEGKPILFRTFWRGRQHLAYIYPVRPGEAHEGPVTRVLVITRWVGGDANESPIPDGVERLESEVIDLGELGVLSPRELVVLALLGQGLSAKEAAAHVHRSEKTIQTQRDSISRKLHLKNRGELVKLVQHVGLTVADAERLDVNS